MYAPEIKLFQFPIGKVQRENDSFWTQERIEKFQFLIGKVQRTMLIAVYLFIVKFQFLIGKVQLSEKKAEQDIYCSYVFQFLIGKVQQDQGMRNEWRSYVSIPHR